ncbi:hypothetical protein X777_03874 [Ooceraea biroi]|uniref:Uncharacterized protein n=1 Tax=Ooceraea biroi TaxID=2015173 RepID=A0A026WLS3_OOCBI|nr:hypothetical protein X777_03874 [Ooceraea biroi]
MLVNRFNWWLEVNKLLPSSQFGFRKQQSCIDNLSILYAEILKTFQADKAVVESYIIREAQSECHLLIG